MKKGRFGISLAAIAAIAFGFTALRQPQSVLLVAGFALLAEKDEWLNRQVLQALLLTIAYYITSMVMDWIFGGIGRLFGFLGAYAAHTAMLSVNAFVGDVVNLALIVFSILAILKVLRGNDAGLPLVSKMAEGGLASTFSGRPGPGVPPTQQYQPVNGGNAQPSGPGFTSHAPVQPGPSPTGGPDMQQVTAKTQGQIAEKEASGSPIKKCSSCGAALKPESRFCTQCGTKNE